MLCFYLYLFSFFRLCLLPLNLLQSFFPDLTLANRLYGRRYLIISSSYSSRPDVVITSPEEKAIISNSVRSYVSLFMNISKPCRLQIHPRRRNMPLRRRYTNRSPWQALCPPAICSRRQLQAYSSQEPNICKRCRRA